jgi:hypothetical protein
VRVLAIQHAGAPTCSSVLSHGHYAGCRSLQAAAYACAGRFLLHFTFDNISPYTESVPVPVISHRCSWQQTTAALLSLQLGWGLWLFPSSYARLGEQQQRLLHVTVQLSAATCACEAWRHIGCSRDSTCRCRGGQPASRMLAQRSLHDTH